MSDDIVTVIDAFIVTFFVNETHERLVSRVEQVLGLYADFVGLQAVPYRLDEDGEVVDIVATSAGELLDEIFHRDPDADMSVIRLVGAVDDQTGYGFKYVADRVPDPRYPDLRNLISLWLPTTLCRDVGWDFIYEFSCRVAAMLPYSYGYGSPCLAYSDISEALGPARRYPGFDIASGIACRIDVDDKALGVYWLNFLGGSLSATLGGHEALASSVAPPITVKELAGNGSAIRLGPEPEVGDTNRRIQLPLYRRFAEVIERQLHVPGNVYFPDENGLRDRDGMMAWHRRFLTSE